MRPAVRRLLLHLIPWIVVIRGSGLIAGRLPGHDVEPGWPDTSIPLVPEAVWLYMPLFFFPIVLCLPAFAGVEIDRQAKRLDHFTRATWIATGIAIAVYFLWPLRIPYPDTPDTVSGHVLRWVQKQDYNLPANKFPAFHATFPLLCVFAIFRQGLPRWSESVVFAAALFIGSSAFLVKQHLFIDVIAGAALAFLAWRLAKFRRSKPALRGAA